MQEIVCNGQKWVVTPSIVGTGVDSCLPASEASDGLLSTAEIKDAVEDDRTNQLANMIAEDFAILCKKHGFRLSYFTSYTTFMGYMASEVAEGFKPMV